MSTAALEAREAASPGGRMCMGTPPTPMPPFRCTGTVALLAALLDDGDGARHVPGDRLARVDVDRRSEDRGAGLGRELHLLARPEAGQAHAVVLELAVHAEHELAGHADLDAEVRERGADALDRLQGGQEVGVAGRAGGIEVDEVGARLRHARGDGDDVFDGQLHRLFLGGARLGDLAERQQLRPVGDRAVGHGVQAEVGHGAVPARRRDQELRLTHDRLLEPEDGLGRLVRVVLVVELDGVGAQVLLVVLQVVDARAHVLAAAAVVAQRDLVADVDGAEARAAAEDVEQVRDLVLGERLHLGALDGGRDPVADGGLDLGGRHAHQGAVAHAGRDGCSTALPPLRQSGPSLHAGNRLSPGDTSPKLTAAAGRRWGNRRGVPPRGLEGRGPARG